MPMPEERLLDWIEVQANPRLFCELAELRATLEDMRLKQDLIATVLTKMLKAAD